MGVEIFIALSKISINSKWKGNLLIFGLLLISLLFIFSYGVNNVSAASGDTIYVNTHGNDNWNGLNSKWTNGTNGPKATIKNATGTVNNNGIVKIAKGTYKENNITINNNLNIIGENELNTIINGTNSGLIFNVASGVKLTINKLTLTNGNNTNGGAINNQGTLTVNSCTFTHNTANNDYSGGAIYNDISSTLNVNGCTFTGNTAQGGGAIYNFYGNINVNGSNFTNNIAYNDWGGAIWNIGGTITTLVTITGSTFYKNSGNNGNGGAIYNGNTMIINKCNFSSNTASFNGGAIVNFGTLNATACKFTNNAAAFGGAIENEGICTVIGSTITNNKASSYKSSGGVGGAIYNGSIITLHFNRIFENYAQYGNGTYIIYNSGGTVDASLNWWGSNNNPSRYLYGDGITLNSWLVLNINANPVTMGNNNKSIITGNLLKDNNGNLVNGYFPDETPISFTTTLGTIGSLSKTVSGIAQSTLNSGLIAGIATVSAKLDNQTMTILFTIKDTIPPKVSANPISGLYNISKFVTLNMSESGKIYYTLNGTTPTITSTNYKGPIIISKTTIFKYLAVDLAGNKSPVYTAKYTIDKTAPKVTSTTPVNNAKSVSLTSVITIKFNEKISKSINFSNIYIKNISTGKIVKSTVKSISGNTITLIMTRSRLSLNNYQVYIPTKAVKDTAGNNNIKYVLNFKTSKY